MTRKIRHFTGRQNAHAAIRKTPARSIAYKTPLDIVTLNDGTRAPRYVPTFTPATDAERATVIRYGFRCSDEG